jgi:hypothetical protein
MRDDERVFAFGFSFLIVALIVTAAFHVAFDSADKDLRGKIRIAVALEKDLDNASVQFSALVRPEVLRPIVMRLYPNYRPIGTGRTISAKELDRL